MHLHGVTVVVDEYDQAVQHYVGDLGFTLLEDTDLGGGKRWVRVAPSDSEGSCILLARAANEKQASAVGNQTGGRVGFFLHTITFEEDHARLIDREIAIVEGPRDEPYGRVLVFRDRYGNLWDLIGS